MIVQKCLKCGLITTIHGEFDCCQERQTEFLEEEEHDGSTSERGYSEEEEHQDDSKANLPCPPLVGAFWGPHGKLVYFNKLIPYKFPSLGPNLRTRRQWNLLFDCNLMNTDDPFVGPSELGIGSTPTLKAGGLSNNKAFVEDDEYSFQSDFVNHFNPTMSPALESDARTTPVNPAFSFESPFVGSNPSRRSFSRENFDIGVASNIVSTDTVIIRDYSRLFSFNKSFAINSKILPSIEACRHNAKLSKTLGLPKSVQRAWNISKVICGSEVLDKKRSKLQKRRTALIDPVRTLATHLLLRFIKAQNYQMVTLLWGVFHHAGLNLDKANGAEEKSQEKWIQRIHEFIEGYADELFRIDAYLQRAQVLKCTPSSILHRLKECELAKRESSFSPKTIAATSPVAKRKRSSGTINRNKATLPNSLYFTGSNLQIKASPRKMSLEQKSRTPQLHPKSRSGMPVWNTRAAYWKQPFGIQIARSHSDTDISMQSPIKKSSPDNLDPRRSSRVDAEWSKHGVRRFLPTWNTRMRGTDDIHPQPKTLPAQPPENSTTSTSYVCLSDELRCYVCELSVRGFWVVCSICGRGGHLEHMLTPDLEIGHFCILK